MVRRHKHAALEPYHCRHCNNFHVGEPQDYGKRAAIRSIRQKAGS